MASELVKHRPYEHGRVTVNSSLRIRPEARDRLQAEAQKRNLTPSGLAALIVETMAAETHSDLFAAVLDDD